MWFRPFRAGQGRTSTLALVTNTTSSTVLVERPRRSISVVKLALFTLTFLLDMAAYATVALFAFEMVRLAVVYG